MELDFYKRLGVLVDKTVILLNTNMLTPIQETSKIQGSRFMLMKQAPRNILAILHNMGECSLKYLSLYGSLSYANLSQMMESLIIDGLIEKFTKEDSKKVIYVRLTEKGKAFMEESNAMFDRGAKLLLENIYKESELMELYNCLSKIENILQKHKTK
ncbi:MAG: hypothetical protein PHX51_01560 [Clostridia bacterium]|nr:hypothetical protein [Clostridia bacterium]